MNLNQSLISLFCWTCDYCLADGKRAISHAWTQDGNSSEGEMKKKGQEICIKEFIFGPLEIIRPSLEAC